MYVNSNASNTVYWIQNLFYAKVSTNDTLEYVCFAKVVFILTYARIASDLDFKTSCFLFNASFRPRLTIWSLYFSQSASTICETVNAVCFWSNCLWNSFVKIKNYVIVITHQVNIRCLINKWHFITVPFFWKKDMTKMRWFYF